MSVQIDDPVTRAGGNVGLARWMTARARATPERAAISFEGRTQTYGELDERIRRTAAALAAGSVGAGDRVGFLAHNQPQFLEVMFAAAAIGAVFVPLNFRCTGPELAYMIDFAEVHTLVVDAPHRPTIDGVRGELQTVTRWIGVEEASDGWEALEEIVAAAEPAAEIAAAHADDCAVIMFTSGTTGRPKGAMLSHGNLWWSAMNVLTTANIAYEDSSLVVAPLFHIGGLNVTTLVTLIKGGRLIIHRGFDPAAALSCIAEERITTMFGVPAMFQVIATLPEFADADLSSIEIIVCGGAPLPEGLIRTYLDRGVNFAQGYGLTEGAPMLSFLTPEYALGKVGSAGRAPMFTELAIVDPEGNHLTAPDAAGEICGRGPNVMLGYLKNPEATEATIDADGWLHTGDGGYRDADGFYYVSDRLKDMIISGGENIYPAEVESVLFGHPAIAEAAVIGVADEQWGETVCAIVALTPGEPEPTLEDLRAFAGESLARYKLPRHLHVVDALPRNPTGKILKVELRKQFG